MPRKIKLRVVIWLLVSILTNILNAQGTQKCYTIKGYFKNIKTPNDYVYLQRITGSGINKMDSAKLHGDHFTFNGKTEPRMVKIFTKRLGQPRDTNFIMFFLDEGNIKVTARYDTSQPAGLSDIKISGSAAQKELERFETGFGKKPLAGETGKYDAINKYIKTHPNSFVSLHLLGTIVKQLAISPVDDKHSEAEGLYSGLDTVLRSSANGLIISTQLKFIRRRLLIGKKANDFSLPTPEGTIIKLSDYNGKYVLLEFWASWCHPCRAESPNLLKAYQKYKDKGFDILAFSLDKSKEAWKKAIKDDGLIWTQVSDLRASNSEVVQQLVVMGIPDNFLIDPNGIIIARGLRGDDLNKKLAEIFE